jgi:hypothetical protein
MMDETVVFKTAKYMNAAFVIICAILLVQAKWASAADDNPVTYKSVLKFGGGVVSAFLIHEGAHALVGVVTGTKMDWKAGDVNQPITFTEYSSSKEKGLAINSSGLLAQAACAEIILQYDKIDKNDSYVRGMMLWNILNPIMYTIDYWVIRKTNSSVGNGYSGDLQGVEHYSSKGTADVFAGTMLAIAAFQGYRFVRTQSWAPEWIKGQAFDNVGLTPLPSGGAFLSYSFDF